MKTISFLFIFLFGSILFVQSQDFIDVSIKSGIQFLPTKPKTGIGWGGIAVIDYNKDGLEDIYIPGGTSSDALYKNNGNGTFTNVIEKICTKALTDKVITVGAFSGDINNDGLIDLFITTAFPNDTTTTSFSPNFLFLNKGDGTFKDISNSSNIGKDTVFSSAAAFGDINNDGFLDLYVSNLVANRNDFERLSNVEASIINLTWDMSPDIIYLNNKDGTFTNLSNKYGIIDPGAGLGCSFFDSNNDGNVDLYTANDDYATGDKVFPNKLFKNLYPLDTFVDIAASSNVNERNTSMGIAVGDYDENGFFDFYITYCGNNSLFRNNGDGTFTNTAVVAGVTNETVRIDSLNTVRQNIDYTYTPFPGFVGIDSTIAEFCPADRKNGCILLKIYINVVEVKEDSVFHPVRSFMPINQTWQEGVGLEVEQNKSIQFCFPFPKEIISQRIITPYKHGVEKLQFENTEIPTTSWGTNFLDYDNDGLLDLYVSNGNESHSGAIYNNSNALFKNIGNGRFKDVSESSGANTPWSSRGSVILDYDNDGDEDIFVMNLSYSPNIVTKEKPYCILYKNNLLKDGYNNWLEVQLKGIVSNSEGIGATVKAHIGFRTIMRQIDGGSSHMSKSSSIAHFGLGPYRKVDSLEILWPGGCKQMVYNVSINKKLTIIQNCGEVFSDTVKTTDSVSVNVNRNTISDNKINFKVISKSSKKIKLELYDNLGNKRSDIFYGDIKKNQTYNFPVTVKKDSVSYYIYKIITPRGVFSNKISLFKN